MVLTTGLINDVRDDIQDRLEAILLYGAVGTDSTTPAASDTALGAEVFRDAVDEVDKSQDDSILVSLRVLTTEANGNLLAEVGWFNASSSGTMFTRNTFTAITKTADIQVFLDTTITIAVTEG